MKNFVLLYHTLIICALSANSQNVGIGVPLPLVKLHVEGLIRSDSLAGTQGRVVFADSLGTLINAPAGNAGEVLVSQGSGSLPVWLQLHPEVFSLQGTATLNADNSTLGNWALIPNMTTTVNADPGDEIFIIADGGVQNQSPFGGIASYTDVGIFVDNVLITNRRVPAINNSTAVYSVGLYSLSTTFASVSGGTHTITVQAKKYNAAFENTWVSSGVAGSPGPGNPPIQANMTAIVLKK